MIAGVACLGAGAIICGGDGGTGLTSGARLWMSGAVGIACGGGCSVIAVLGAVLALVILCAVNQPERMTGR